MNKITMRAILVSILIAALLLASCAPAAKEKEEETPAPADISTPLNFTGTGNFTSPVFEVPSCKVWLIEVELTGLPQDHDPVLYKLEVFKEGETTPSYNNGMRVYPKDEKKMGYMIGESLPAGKYYLMLSGDNLESWGIRISKWL